MKTLGISPKAYLPALVLFAAGIGLFLLGRAYDDATLTDMGYGALSAAVVGFGIAYQAPPGEVEETVVHAPGTPADRGDAA